VTSIAGRSISKGKARGLVLKIDEQFSFLGGVDTSAGDLRGRDGNISGKIFVFPHGKGSTVGSFTMYDLKTNGKHPAAIINRVAETIVATGAVISSIPMVDSVDIDILRNGDDVTVDGDNGTIEIHNVKTVTSVSSAVLSDRGVLLLKRPDDASSFPGVWSLAAGHKEDDESFVEAAKREIFEETGLTVDDPSVTAEPIYVRENDVIWNVHPFLFKCGRCDVRLNDENTDHRWVHPEKIGELCTVTSTLSAVKGMLSKLRTIE
jgi:hypothetical protein